MFLMFLYKKNTNGKLFSKVVKPILPVNSIKSHILYKHVLDALIYKEHQMEKLVSKVASPMKPIKSLIYSRCAKE